MGSTNYSEGILSTGGRRIFIFQPSSSYTFKQAVRQCAICNRSSLNKCHWINVRDYMKSKKTN